MKKMIRSLALCLSILLVCVEWAVATDPETRVSQYGHSVWRVQDGVLNAAPTVIAQSKDGYIWIGTETGLLRFDGMRFVPFNPPGWDRITAPEIVSLLAASDGTLWISTPTELASWNQGKLTIVPLLPKMGQVSALVEDHQGKIWATFIQTSLHKPLCEISREGARCFGANDGLLPRGAETLIVDPDGNFTLGSSDSLIEWSPDRGRQQYYSFPGLAHFGSGSAGIYALQRDSDGSILVAITIPGRGLGLERLKSGVASAYSVPGMDGSSLAPQALWKDKFGALWIGTVSNGLYRVAGSRVDHFTTKEGLSGDAVRGFLEDREGNMWVVTDAGVDSFHDLKVLTWSANEGLLPGNVTSILASRDGSVLVGVNNVLEILRDGQVQQIGRAQGLPGDNVTSLAQARSGRYWVGVADQLTIYDGRKFTPILRADGQRIGPTSSIAADADGSIWASTVGPTRGFVHVKNGKVDTISTNTGLGYILTPDKQSGVWVNGFGKLFFYSNGQLRTFPLRAGNGSTTVPVVNDLVTAVDGSILGSSRVGVWGIREGKVQRMGTANGLPCQSAKGLSFADKQTLLVRTSCGLLEISSEALSKWWANSTVQIPYQLIDSSDGAHMSSSSYWPQMSLAPDGRIWMANEGSIQVFDPKHVPVNSTPPPVHIEEVIADRAQFDSIAGMELPPLARDVEIHYTALSFNEPQKVRFRYRLEGRDTAWQEPGTRRTAFYQNLRPGHYRFRVIAANNDGVWNNAGDTFEFSVQPAWFQTIWFRFAWMVSVCLLIAAIYHVRVRYIAKAINSRFDERLDERTRMARELHDTFLQTVQGSKMVADDALDPASDETRMRHALEKLSVWLGQAVTEGRAALHSLRVSTMERNHLAEFLERTAKVQSERSPLSVAFTVIGDARDLHPIMRDEVAKIAEEAIRNAALHSKASQLRIELRYANDLYLDLKDNGLGIDPNVMNAGKPGHFGLQGMKERSARIGASITITSNSNAGTEIALRVPGKVIYRNEGRPFLRRLSDSWRNLLRADGRSKVVEEQNDKKI
jgi:signal transduction histidine kinase/ligand-binding sensor domain-containing protein